MRYLKKILSNLSGAMGFALIIGTAGKSDYMDAINQSTDFKRMVIYLIIGTILLIPFYLHYKDWGV